MSVAEIDSIAPDILEETGAALRDEVASSTEVQGTKADELAAEVASQLKEWGKIFPNHESCSYWNCTKARKTRRTY